MAGAAKTAKKNIRQKIRMLDGKVVKTVLYDGKMVGHGKYMAAMIDDKLVLDEHGKPREFRYIGKLEWNK